MLNVAYHRLSQYSKMLLRVQFSKNLPSLNQMLEQ